MKTRHPYSVMSLVNNLALVCMAGSALERQAAAQAPAPVLKVGMSAAFSGPSEELGLHMRRGIEAYFARVNAQGGIFGKHLSLVALDDGYEPARTGPNMRNLIGPEQVFAILGNVGTPTATVAVPIAIAKKVPFVGAFTGAGLLRKTPPDRYVINYRASYAEETAAMVRGFVKDLNIKPEEIGFFTQNDAYGDSGYQGGLAALAALGYHRGNEAPHGRYPRNTTDVEEALSVLMDPKVHLKAIIMVGVYKPCAKFITLARRHGLSAIFANVSFVGSDALATELGKLGDGVVVTQVVPHYGGQLPVLKEYHEQLAPKDVNFVSLEGFLAAKAFAEGLRMAGPNPTPERFIAALESGQPIDLGLDTRHQLSSSEHQFSHKVWPTYIQNGQFLPLQSWRDLPRAPPKNRADKSSRSRQGS